MRSIDVLSATRVFLRCPSPSANSEGMTELQALLAAATDAIIVIDGRGYITTFNAAAERLFGYIAAEVLGKSVDVLMPERYRSEQKDYIERFLATGQARIVGTGREVLGRHAGGHTFPITLSVGEAHDANGQRFVGIIRDLSERKATELQARSLEGQLAQLGRFDLMDEMAAGIAHEINQPLSAIATYAQAARRILERDQPGMTVLIDVCRKIDEQALRAGRVIDNLRQVIRKQDVRTELLDVNAVVRDIVNLIRADAYADGIRVTTRYADDLAPVRGNAVQLQQVLLNLTRNAVDAMRGSANRELGIEIITGSGDNGGVRITVADHGPGVSSHLGDAIFHPFVTTKRDGLGVGLAISRTIVQSCGGTLTHGDNPPGGAVFTVDLPSAKEDDSEPQQQEAAAER